MEPDYFEVQILRLHYLNIMNLLSYINITDVSLHINTTYLLDWQTSFQAHNTFEISNYAGLLNLLMMFW